jgi:hypothetical protein
MVLKLTALTCFLIKITGSKTKGTTKFLVI